MRGPANQKIGKGRTHTRHTLPANMTCSDATLKIFPGEKPRGGGTILHTRPLRFAGFKHKDSKYPAPYPQEELKRGERRDNLEGSQRPQGEGVRLDRRLHTTEAQAFAGTRALRTKSLCSTTGHGQPSIFRPQEGMERHTGLWRSIIRWRSACTLPERGRIPRETANHQYKRATKCTSREKWNH